MCVCVRALGLKGGETQIGRTAGRDRKGRKQGRVSQNNISFYNDTFRAACCSCVSTRFH